jgi:hypothetical protein
MAPNRITRGAGVRRALVLLAVTAASAFALTACGGGGGEATGADLDKVADAETLNNVLTREMAAIGAYDSALAKLDGADLAIGREFRAAEQEHVDAIVKALRGLGGKAEPEAEEIESGGLDTRRAALEFLYEVESVSVAADLRAISHLTAPWPRSLLGSIAANQAQHLVALRRALGADAAESIPRAFEDGTAPLPGANSASGAAAP